MRARKYKIEINILFTAEFSFNTLSDLVCVRSEQNPNIFSEKTMRWRPNRNAIDRLLLIFPHVRSLTTIRFPVKASDVYSWRRDGVLRYGMYETQSSTHGLRVSTRWQVLPTALKSLELWFSSLFSLLRIYSNLYDPPSPVMNLQRLMCNKLHVHTVSIAVVR